MTAVSKSTRNRATPKVKTFVPTARRLLIPADQIKAILAAELDPWEVCAVIGGAGWLTAAHLHGLVVGLDTADQVAALKLLVEYATAALERRK